MDAPARPAARVGTADGRAAIRNAHGFAVSLARTMGGYAAAERSRIGLWTPVALGVGAAWYFSLPSEPAALAAPSVFTATLFIRSRLSEVGRIAALGIALVAAGFGLADLRTQLVRAPLIETGQGPRIVVGRIISLEEGASARRAFVAVTAISGVARPPARARIVFRGEIFDAAPGDLVRFRAVLRPPPEPETPNGFDYGRLLYFERVGALGFALSPPRRLAESDRPALVRFSAAVESLRNVVTRRILQAAPSQGGALVAASITGDRAAISEATDRALRDSGLAHLIAISGLNMALATGIVFFAIRSVLALVPPLALGFPIKKWAAIAALGSGVVYLVLSGSAWSAVRAFIMAAILFVAVVFDRRALTLRNVAVAATIILVLTPEAATQPGFQMSFAAVTALVAAYEFGRQRFRPDPAAGLIDRVRRYALGLAATDIVASSATAPFSLFHFSRAALFGLPANMLAGPIMAFVLMPFAVLGMVLAPFGLDAPAFRAAALGGDAIIWIGTEIAAIPDGVVSVAQGPAVALGVATLGGLWLCVMTRPWRWAGLLVLLAGAAPLMTAAPPDILVSRDGAAVGVHVVEQNALAMNEPARWRFLARVWSDALGLEANETPAIRLDSAARCILGVCRLDIKGQRVSIAISPQGAARACARADLVVALAAGAKGLRCTAPVVRGGEPGAVAIWIGKSGRVRIKSVAEMRGFRPWAMREDERQ